MVSRVLKSEDRHKQRREKKHLFQQQITKEDGVSPTDKKKKKSNQSIEDQCQWGCFNIFNGAKKREEKKPKSKRKWCTGEEKMSHMLKSTRRKRRLPVMKFP